MAPVCVPLPPVSVPILLVEIVASPAVLGSIAPSCPGSAVPDGAVSSVNCDNAHPGEAWLGCARLLFLGDYIAAPVAMLLVSVAWWVGALPLRGSRETKPLLSN